MDDPRGRLTRDGIRIHEPADFAGMRTAGRLAAKILDEVAALVEPGVPTEALDAFIEGRLKFTAMADVVAATLDLSEADKGLIDAEMTLDNVAAADHMPRIRAREHMAELA